MTFKTARNTAFTFFGIGTFIFLIALVVQDLFAVAILGFIFLVFAIVYNTTAFFILLFELIKYNRLESFFGLCLILANAPIAFAYCYLIINYL